MITPDGFDDTSPQGNGSENMNAKTVNEQPKTTDAKPKTKGRTQDEKQRWKAEMQEKSAQILWDKLVAPMLEGDLPRWKQPWKQSYTPFGSTMTVEVDLDPNAPFCADHESKAHLGYSGFNRAMLSIFAASEPIPAFATKKQWAKIQKRIAKAKGESTKDLPLVIDEENEWKIIPLMHPIDDRSRFLGVYEVMGRDGKPIMVKCRKTGKMKPKTKPRFAKRWDQWGFFAVYPFTATNLDLNDVMNVVKWQKKKEEFIPEPILRMDELIARCDDLESLEGAQELAQKMLHNVALAGGLKHDGGNRACYVPLADMIMMPKAEDFRGDDNAQKLSKYAHTLCHEFSHATGHHTRLRRDLRNAFGSEGYAREELVAEISAVIACANLGIEVTDGPQHGTYLKGWANRLVGHSLREENPEAWKEVCWKMMRDAQSAAEWVAFGTIPEAIQRRLNAEAEAKAKGEQVAVPDAAGDAPDVSYDNPLEVVA